MSTAQYDLEDMTMREIIELRLDELGISRWRLAHNVAQIPKRKQRAKKKRGKKRGKKKKRTADTLSASSTFRYLKGEHDAMGEHVEAMLRACGLRIVAERKPPGWIQELKAG